MSLLLNADINTFKQEMDEVLEGLEKEEAVEKLEHLEKTFRDASNKAFKIGKEQYETSMKIADTFGTFVDMVIEKRVEVEHEDEMK